MARQASALRARNPRRALAALLALAPLAACAAGPGNRPAAAPGSIGTRQVFDSSGVPGRPGYRHPGPYRDGDARRYTRRNRPYWGSRTARYQGTIGLAELLDLQQSAGTFFGDAPGDEDLFVPTIGGGFQWKYSGEAVEWGFEGLLSVGGRGSINAVAADSDTLVEVDVDLVLFDAFGGPFVNVWPTEDLRLYVGAGPLAQYADFRQESEFAEFEAEGSGFGLGWYARVGVELLVSGGTSVGIAARYAESDVDLDGGLGDLELEGIQYLLTVTTGW